MDSPINRKERRGEEAERTTSLAPKVSEVGPPLNVVDVVYLAFSIILSEKAYNESIVVVVSELGRKSE